MTLTTRTRSRLLGTLLSMTGMLVGALYYTAGSAATLESVQKAGVVRIAVPQDYAPFGYAGSDLTLQGFDVEVAKLTAAALHVKLQIVPVTMANKIPYLVTNKVDIALNLGKNPERAKVIDFTEPYAPYYTAVFGPHAAHAENLDALKGKKIAVVTSSQEDLFVTKNAPAGVQIYRYQDNSAAVSAFLSGQTEFLATGNIVGAKLLSDNAQRGFEQKFLLMDSPVHAAVRKGDDAMLEAVNHALEAERKSGQLDALSRQWLKQPLEAQH